MKFLRFLTILALLFSLTTLIVSYSLLQIVATGTSISDTLKSGGVYSVIANQARTSLGASPKVPAKYQALFNSSLEKTVDTSHIEAMLKPAIVDIATWLDQPAGTSAPDVIIVVKPAKDDLIQEMANGGLNKIELAALQSELSQQIPDQIRLSSLQDLVGESSSKDSTQTGNASVQPSTQPGEPTTDSVLKALDQVKTAVSSIRIVFLVSCFVSILMTLVTAVMSHRLGRSWTKALAIAYGVVGSFWLLIALIVPMVFQASTTTVSMDTLAMHVLPVLTAHILGASIFISIMYILIAGVCVAISLFRRTKSPHGHMPQMPIAPRRQ